MRVLVVLALALASCATVTPPDENAIVGRLIADTVDAMRATADRQRDQVTRAAEAYKARPDDPGSLRLALLLAHLPPPHRDEDRALGLLAPIVARQGGRPVAHFAALLGEQIRERQRIERDAAQALRREAAMRSAGEEREQLLRQRLDALRAIESREAALLRRRTEALRAGEQREDVLRRQIEGLRAAERNLLEREERSSVRPR